jgi:photosystem II stability/assembly factor-like uncharacterized protein
MKKSYLLFITISLIISCQKKVATVESLNPEVFNSILIDTVFEDKISIRAILIDENKVWYAADNGKYGFYEILNNKSFNGNIAKDTFKLEFRSIAKNNKNIFLINVGNPAFLYAVSNDGQKVDLVYQEKNEKVFYDAMQFWNNNDGIAMGDPTENCLSVLTTKNGGLKWQKLACGKLPKVAIGEAAFAASNTNLIVRGNKTWMVSGGKKARVFYSPDKGNSWQVFETPIVQGKAMTGIFSCDFYNENKGIIVGGDYEKPDQKFGNKAITDDGGKTWQLIAENKGFGYASCVQYVPNSDGKQIVTVGASGIYYTFDTGKSWQQLAKDTDLYTIRFSNDSTAFAAGKDKIIKIKFIKKRAI